MDMDEKTCWAEGSEGDGIGEVILYTVRGNMPINAFYIKPGFQQSEKLFYANGCLLYTSTANAVSINIYIRLHRRAYGNSII